MFKVYASQLVVSGQLLQSLRPPAGRAVRLTGQLQYANAGLIISNHLGIPASQPSPNALPKIGVVVRVDIAPSLPDYAISNDRALRSAVIDVAAMK